LEQPRFKSLMVGEEFFWVAFQVSLLVELL
jgi:hypothetical protein